MPMAWQDATSAAGPALARAASACVILWRLAGVSFDPEWGRSVWNGLEAALSPSIRSMATLTGSL